MKKLITEDEVKKVIKSGSKEIVVEKGSVLTPLAKDRILHFGLRIVESKSDSSLSSSISQVKIAVGTDHTAEKIIKIVI